jgi:hypothetical protein
MSPDFPFPGFWYFILLAVGMIAWRIWGERLRAAIDRRDQRRRDAELQSLYDRANPNSHFRHSVEQINQDTAPVQPDQAGGYRWGNMHFLSREEAEAARWRHVLRDAREFYQDLDRSFGNRISGRRSADSINRNPADES